MRRLFALVVLLFGCLLAAQSAVASAAAYDTCCVEGCHDMVYCAGMGCQACAVPSALPAAGPHFIDAPAAVMPMATDQLLKPAPVASVWGPPD